MKRLVCLVLAGFACSVKPDEKSGDDHERHKAVPIKVGEAISDSVNYKAGDRTDWKVVEVLDAGFMTVTVNLDDPKNEVLVAIFDRYGKPVTKVRHRKDDDSPLIQAIVETTPGRYFIMIQAATEGSKTGYALKVTVR